METQINILKPRPEKETEKNLETRVIDDRYRAHAFAKGQTLTTRQLGPLRRQNASMNKKKNHDEG